MPSIPPTVREHFETPEIILASESTAASGLWDVELSALGAQVHIGRDDAAGVGAETGDVSDVAARGTVLVDLGCGAGRSSIALGPFFEEVVLMDLSPRMLETAADGVAAVRGGPEDVTAHHLDLYAELGTRPERPSPTARQDGWERALSRADLATAGNVLCYVRGRDARVRVLRAVLARLGPDARLLVTNHVVPPEGVQELRDMARSAGEDPEALGEDALLDTTSQDGSFVHWFTPESLAEELGAATDGPVDLKVSEDGLRAAALLSSTASAAVGGTG
ncbi:methyltransferase [Brachybacterium sp. AOP43-C2-M15]|uniref:methyltransferase n=1 Tax=Brachybacterium sp. AOP43-C2-M15 TaxID=3457661 RepID=UPI0040347685